MDMLKRIGGAFLVGGVFGVVGQATYMLYTALGAGSLVTVLTLITNVLIGAILFFAGQWERIEKFGGMGANLTFAGFAAAACGVTFGVRCHGGTVGAGVWTAFKKLVCCLVFVCIAICICLAVAVFFISGATTQLGAEAAAFAEQTGAPAAVPAYVAMVQGVVGQLLVNVLTAHDPAMSAYVLLTAFLVCGVISILAELFIALAKCDIRIVLGVFFVLGGLLTIPGLINPIIDFGGGGFTCTIMGFGQAIVTLFCFVLAGGTPGALPFCLILVVITCLVIIYSIFGGLRPLPPGMPGGKAPEGMVNAGLDERLVKQD